MAMLLRTSLVMFLTVAASFASAGGCSCNGSNDLLFGADAGESVGRDLDASNGGADGDPPLVLADAGTLVLRIDGADAGADHDVLLVDGRAQLGGALVLEFGAAFTPTPGQRFQVVVAAEGIDGSFDSISNNKLLTLVPTQDATGFYVTVAP